MSDDMISLIYGVLGVSGLLLLAEGVYRLVSRKLNRLMDEVKRECSNCQKSLLGIQSHG
jgi:hypothetical protein